ncbi:MAG: hypothetical protein WAW63_00435 [Candidatus Saccharimonadales bacterium]
MSRISWRARPDVARISLFAASSCTLNPVRTGNLRSLRSLIADSNRRADH